MAKATKGRELQQTVQFHEEADFFRSTEVQKKLAARIDTGGVGRAHASSSVFFSYAQAAYIENHAKSDKMLVKLPNQAAYS
jgi:hypothetical protein